MMNVDKSSPLGSRIHAGNGTPLGSLPVPAFRPPVKNRPFCRRISSHALFIESERNQLYMKPIELANLPGSVSFEKSPMDRRTTIEAGQRSRFDPINYLFTKRYGPILVSFNFVPPQTAV